MQNQSLCDIDAIELSIPLENNFNRHDEYKGRRVEPVDEIVDINIGSYVSPKMVKIGKNASLKNKSKLKTKFANISMFFPGLVMI